ncbi:MAG: DUF2726 domain-containing protein [Verrucomicrobia bacterium]|nr:DUF2726 domain-containing protein [Verrucomicrobiota bacterium]
MFLTKRGNAANNDSVNRQANFVLNDALLTPAERSFYGALKSCTGDQLEVFAKVRLADVFRPAKGISDSEWRSAQNKVDRKHVDFLLCRTDNLAPVAAIELDDSSHKRASSEKNDDFKNALFAASTIPLIRVAAREAYNTTELATTVNQAINQKKAQANA